jgi:hypothetical protein
MHIPGLAKRSVFIHIFVDRRLNIYQALPWTRQLFSCPSPRAPRPWPSRPPPPHPSPPSTRALNDIVGYMSYIPLISWN